MENTVNIFLSVFILEHCDRVDCKANKQNMSGLNARINHKFCFERLVLTSLASATPAFFHPALHLYLMLRLCACVCLCDLVRLCELMTESYQTPAQSQSLYSCPGQTTRGSGGSVKQRHETHSHKMKKSQVYTSG